jgi:hypothetical protein
VLHAPPAGYEPASRLVEDPARSSRVDPGVPPSLDVELDDVDDAELDDIDDAELDDINDTELDDINDTELDDIDDAELDDIDDAELDDMPDDVVDVKDEPPAPPLLVMLDAPAKLAMPVLPLDSPAEPLLLDERALEWPVSPEPLPADEEQPAPPHHAAARSMAAGERERGRRATEDRIVTTLSRKAMLLGEGVGVPAGLPGTVPLHGTASTAPGDCQYRSQRIPSCEAYACTLTRLLADAHRAARRNGPLLQREGRPRDRACPRRRVTD